MIVVTNSSPLIALSRINRLRILKEQFGEVYIPLIHHSTLISLPCN